MASTAPKEITHKNPEWENFNPGFWQSEINVRDFIQQNYEPYEGDETFLAGATQRTMQIWEKLNRLFVRRWIPTATSANVCQIKSSNRSTSFSWTSRAGIRHVIYI